MSKKLIACAIVAAMGAAACDASETSGGGGSTSTGASTTATTVDAATSTSASATASSSTGGPHTVTACDALPAAGTWEHVSPPDVMAELPGPEDCQFGVSAFVMDPSDYATLYLGTCEMGVWKSTDCGATWAHVNTGPGGSALDTGRQWNFAIDPNDPNVLYTNSGYNGGPEGSGEFKSTDGGVSWSQVWPPSDPDLASIVEYNFVGGIAIDPDDHQHLLLTFHAKCSAPYNEACIGESNDAGATWRLINGDPSWQGGEGQGAWFLDNGHTFLWGAETNGLWRTDDDGDSWSQVAENGSIGHAKGQLHRTDEGRYFLGGSSGILTSADGTSWSLISGSGPQLVTGLVSDGTNMYASSGFPWNPGQGPPPYHPFYTAPESDGMAWTNMDSPLLANGGQLAYDTDHHVLYSSNGDAGFWRVVTP